MQTRSRWLDQSGCDRCDRGRVETYHRPGDRVAVNELPCRDGAQQRQKNQAKRPERGFGHEPWFPRLFVVPSGGSSRGLNRVASVCGTTQCHRLQRRQPTAGVGTTSKTDGGCSRGPNGARCGDVAGVAGTARAADDAPFAGRPPQPPGRRRGMGWSRPRPP
jgi:hypothetical protein